MGQAPATYQRAASVLAAVAFVVVLAFCVVDYHLTFPWHLEGGVNYDAAVRRYTGKVVSENYVGIAVAALACAYQFVLFRRIRGAAPRTARAISIVSTVACAGLLVVYAAMAMVMMRTIGPY